MTIHGAKGLEAPIVMLPDMLKLRTVNQLIGVDQARRSVYWIPPGAPFHPQFLKDAKAVRRHVRIPEMQRERNHL